MRDRAKAASALASLEEKFAHESEEVKAKQKGLPPPSPRDPEARGSKDGAPAVDVEDSPLMQKKENRHNRKRRRLAEAAAKEAAQEAARPPSPTPMPAAKLAK